MGRRKLYRYPSNYGGSVGPTYPNPTLSNIAVPSPGYPSTLPTYAPPGYVPPPAYPMPYPPNVAYVPMYTQPLAPRVAPSGAFPGHWKVGKVPRANHTPRPQFQTDQMATAGLEPALLSSLPHGVRDILVVDFDRALFYCPIPNLDVMDTASARLLEKLGWWESPEVLQAAETVAKWNEPLLELLRVAISTDGVATVIVSGRTSTIEPSLRGMLAKRGIPDPDLFIFSSDVSAPVGLRKQALIMVLSKHYESTLERVCVYEGRPKDVKPIKKALDDLKCDVSATLEEVVGPLSLIPPLEERRLVEMLVRQHNDTNSTLLSTSIQNASWTHELDSDSRMKLCLLADDLADLQVLGEITEYMPGSLLICHGSLPSSMANSVGEVGTEYHWRILGYRIEGTRLRVYCQTTEKEYPPTARAPQPEGVPLDIAKLRKGQRKDFEPLDSPLELVTSVAVSRHLRIRN